MRQMINDNQAKIFDKSVLKEFFDFRKREDTSVADSLKRLVENHGSGILLEKEKLVLALEKEKIDARLGIQLQLLTTIPGFSELVHSSESTVQKNIDLFVTNAQVLAGLTRKRILEITAGVCESLGYFVLKESSNFGTLIEHKKAFIIPYSIYEKQLEEIRGKVANGKILEEMDKQKLEALTYLGIAEAKAYLGIHLWQSNRVVAIQLLTNAADEGFVPAQSFLGDYFYSEADSFSWVKAYKYYTDYGSISLSHQQQKNVVEIIEHKNFNKKVLVMGILFVLAIFATFFIEPQTALYGTNQILRILFFSIEVAILSVSILVYKKIPFVFLDWLVPTLFGIWSIYLFLWLII